MLSNVAFFSHAHSNLGLLSREHVFVPHDKSEKLCVAGFWESLLIRAVHFMKKRSRQYY